VAELRGGVVLGTGAAEVGGWVVSCDGPSAGLGAAGDEVWDAGAQPATPTLASANVRARKRSRSMRMRLV
jgi:hypothetical protein